MIGRTVSRYRILEKLGEGGMGEVYLAHDTELNRRVALKFLSPEYASDPDLLGRFRQEAQTAAGLHHPNIITIYEVGEAEGRPFIAMAYVEGESLGKVIARGDLDPDLAIDVALQIAAGLGVAHDAGIVHRDVKPDNIFIASDGGVQILDFGLAKPGDASRITGPTSTFGTIYFMSPEQVRGEQVDHRSDVFSFGAVLYEMLTGELPFKGEHSTAVIYSIANEDPTPPSQVNPLLDPAFDAVVAKALAKSREERYQSIDELAKDLRNIRSGEAVRGRPRRRKLSLTRLLVPTSVLFAAVVATILLKPFRVEIEPDQSAVAAEASIAIMYFDNVANPDDPKRLGEIITNLLITDLSGSEYMDVVSSQRLYDVLKRQGKEGEKRVDHTTATEVAKATDAKLMLLGSILQEEPTFVVTSQLVDVETGRVVASQRISGSEGEDIFALVDRLTVKIREGLSLPAESELDAPIAEATTHSTEAYRCYVEGMEYVNKYYGQEARECFTRALQHDSTFAMAYLRLASGLVTPNRAQARRAIAKALRYSDRVSEKERLYIQSFDARLRGQHQEAVALLQKIVDEYPTEKDAYRELGDLYRGPLEDTEKAITYYRKAIEIDPLDKFSFNALAYAYQAVGDIDNYIWAIYQYISLAPDEANPYDSRGDLYAYSGKIDKAIASYEKALTQKPDFYPSLIKLGLMHVFLQEYEAAAAAFDQVVASKDPATRSLGRMLQSTIPTYQGRWSRALAVLEEARAADAPEKYEDGPYFGFRWQIYRETGRPEVALAELNRELAKYRGGNPDDKVKWRVTQIHLTALSGDVEGARALLADYRRYVETVEPARRKDYLMAKALTELAAGEAVAACETFDELPMKTPHFFRDYHRALAYLAAERYYEATDVLEQLLRRFSEDRAYAAPTAVKAYYYLGLAYEQAGRPRKAIEQYQVFLDIWKNADPGTDGLEDAASRLRALEAAGTES